MRANQPIKATGSYLYQLDDERKCNLWGGHLDPQNKHDPEYLHNAVKLILASEDMRKVLEELVLAETPQEFDRVIGKAQLILDKFD